MERFEFTEEQHLGLPDIDEQHAHLFDLFNSLVEVDKRGALREEMCLIIEELVNYLDHHFTYEEQALHECVYTDLEEHRAYHAEFVRKAIGFSRDFRQGKEEMSWDILYFLRQWLLDHIMVEDRKYVPFVVESRMAKKV